MAGTTARTCIVLFCCLVLAIAAVEGRTQFIQEHKLHAPCEEIYVVEEGETLQTISEKCNAPFILEDNPHIQDTDDLFQGLVLTIISLDHQHQKK